MDGDNDHLITSTDPNHPANLICTLCRNFYNLGWVTGTGGGASIARDSRIFIAPSGVQKELMQPENIFVMDRSTNDYLRKPLNLKPSACTPLFLAAFDKGAGCCIHTHSQWAVLVTLLVEKAAAESGGTSKDSCFEIEKIEQIKGIPRGKAKPGMLGFFDRLRIPIIENTAHEEDLTQSLEEAMASYPDTYAVLVRRHGVYVWGDDVAKAKTQAESLDYIFRLAVEMRNLSLPWTAEEAVQDAQLSQQALEATKGSQGSLGSHRGQAKRSSEGFEGTIIETTRKRRPGRPLKTETSPSEGLERTDVEIPKKRRPGRPRKSFEGGLIDDTLLQSKPESTQLKAQNDFTAVNGVGNGVNGSAAKKGRGRPKKEVDPDDAVAATIPIHKAAKGRPGRPRRTL